MPLGSLASESVFCTNMDQADRKVRIPVLLPWALLRHALISTCSNASQLHRLIMQANEIGLCTTITLFRITSLPSNSESSISTGRCLDYLHCGWTWARTLLYNNRESLLCSLSLE